MKRLFLLVVFLLSFVATPAFSELIATRKSGDWESFILLVDKTAVARMTTNNTDNTKEATLIISSFPNGCGAPFLQIISCDKAYKDLGLDQIVTGAVRVDSRSVFDVHWKMNVEGSCVLYMLLSQNSPTIFKDFVAGKEVRFKIDFSDGKRSLYKKFSLTGFTSAYKRTLTLCEEIRKTLTEKKDSDFFEGEQRLPTPTKPSEPSQQQKTNDAEFFI